MKIHLKTPLFLVALVATFGHVDAQYIESSYNQNTVRPVRQDDVSFQKTVWIRTDLRQKMNEPFFPADGQITKIIIDAVKAGMLRPFQNDSLASRMNSQTFLENLSIETGIEEEFPDWDAETESTEWDGWETEESVQKEAIASEFFPSQLYLVELKTNVLFDRKRSRQYNEIEAVTIIIPAELNPTGIERVLATFSYKELVENVFQDNPNATAFNAGNTAAHFNLTDAFELALMDGTITKYTNPKGQLIEDMHFSSKEALGASQKYQHQLMEGEHNLWSN